MDLKATISELKVKERGWEVLDCRVGFSEHFTLEEIATIEDVTRQRVQQIQSIATRQIVKNFRCLIPILNMLENEYSCLWEPFDSTVSFDVAANACRKILEQYDWSIVDTATLEKFFVALRALADRQSVPTDMRWPKIFLAVCALSPSINRYQPVSDELLKKQQAGSEQSRNWMYHELVDLVLREAKMPLHWTDIASAAEDVGHRSSFSATSLYNAISAAPDKYIRVAAGTYGLAEWGLSSLGNYVDIIATTLKMEGHTLNYEQIRSRVDSVRKIKESSLTMFLYMHPRFYQSVGGTFGLRAWLTPRDRQTLRTPRWLVEDSDSFLRVSRAEKRGYDIARLIAADEAK